MAARGYEFYLRVLKVSLTPAFAALIRERHFQHSKKKFVSPHGHVISSMYREDNRNELLRLKTGRSLSSKAVKLKP